MSDERKVWQVTTDVPANLLEKELNALANENYQVHSVHMAHGDAGTEPVFTVIAFDPMLIMAKQGNAMASNLADLMSKVQTP